MFLYNYSEAIILHNSCLWSHNLLQLNIPKIHNIILQN